MKIRTGFQAEHLNDGILEDFFGRFPSASQVKEALQVTRSTSALSLAFDSASY